MAKSERSEKKGKSKGGDPLAEALLIFGRGDYARARPALAALESAPELSEGAKQQARQLLGATRVERGALLVGLFTLLMVSLVVIVTALTQPG